MILYRTDDFSKNRSTDIRDVLKYEIIDRENTDIFQSISELVGTGSTHEIGPYSIKDLTDALATDNQATLNDIIEKILQTLNEHFNKNLTHAIWLYSLDNVENYFSFEGIEAVVDGYETSDIILISYNDEGVLYAYEEEPQVKERV